MKPGFSSYDELRFLRVLAVSRVFKSCGALPHQMVHLKRYVWSYCRPSLAGHSRPEVVAGGNGHGAGPHQFLLPYGICVSNIDGSVYVADVAAHRVTRWAPGATCGDVCAGGNGVGAGLGQLQQPHDISLGPGDRQLFVADRGNHRIVVWNRGTSEGEVVAGNDAAHRDHGALCNPSGVSVDDSGALLVADRSNRRVRKFWPAMGDHVGADITDAKFGSEPLALASGSNSQMVYVLCMNNTVNVVRDEAEVPDTFGSSTSRGLPAKWVAGGRHSPKEKSPMLEQRDDESDTEDQNHTFYGYNNPKYKTNEHLNMPASLCYDSRNDCVYVSDRGNCRIQRFDKDCGGIGVTVHDGFRELGGVCVDNCGNLYVVDVGWATVSKLNACYS